MNSVFEIFKIGVGPSSSHTVGPMKAGKQFIDELIHMGIMADVSRLAADVYGSLSLTGVGHGTDVAILMGLSGMAPDTVDIDAIPTLISKIKQSQRLSIYDSQYEIAFPLNSCMNFHSAFLPLHENGLRLSAFTKNDTLLFSQIYYSVGGGTVVTEQDLNNPLKMPVNVPFPFVNAETLIQYCDDTGLSIFDLVLQNELLWHSQEQIQTYFNQVYATMQNCIDRGIKTTGVLPGPLAVRRRAAALYHTLSTAAEFDPMQILDWVNMFALAVSEENAAGGRVVTAPTNGACGIIPAVLAYYDKFIESITPDLCTRFFLTTGAIGLLYQMNASISGAEVGCQGEVGVACSMAAAGLVALYNGTPRQICTAAEIGMEHNLGLTCDPINGQVQVPCIERNAIASVKAITAARMALQRTTSPHVSLDQAITTMYETGKDMNPKYRETSQGGLAVTVSYCD